MTLRTEGWAVAPTFVPHAPHEPITLLFDESGLTQLAGDPVSAWQTPWSQLHRVVLVKFPRSVALFATAAGVRYCWRRTTTAQWTELRDAVRAAGGVTETRRRAVAPVLVAVLVSLVAASGTLWSSRNTVDVQLAQTRAVNLTLADLGPRWFLDPTGFIQFFASPPGLNPTVPPMVSTQHTAFAHSAKYFQNCFGVTNARDRVYGLAAQVPDYQVGSNLFRTESNGGVEVASTTQYYATTEMVRRDVAEMSRPDFGKCLTDAQVVAVNGASGGAWTGGQQTSSWRPQTGLGVWARAGESTNYFSTISLSLTLDVVVVAHGHYEVTLTALSADPQKARATIESLVRTLSARISSTSPVSAA